MSFAVFDLPLLTISIKCTFLHV